MELKYENIKSIILGILIVTSLLLTWNLWTYQPSYDELQDTKVVKEVSIGTKKGMKEVVRANQIVFHLHNEYYGTIDNGEVEKIMNEIRSWTLSSFEDISLEEGEHIPSLINKNNMVEIYYPDNLSIDTFKKINPIKDNEVENFNFDQIVIDLNVHGKEGIIYFLSQKDKQIYKTTVPPGFITDFTKKYSGHVLANYTKYLVYRPERAEKPIYLPAGETELVSYKYLAKEIDPNDFKDALFDDPSLVQNSHITVGKEFTDGQSIMRVYLEESMIHYVNLAVADNISDGYGDILQRSIDFVNAHGGFTGPYRFEHIDPEHKEVLFRLYTTDGYPIFGQNQEDSISDIRIVLGETDINEYKRNNFHFGLLSSDNKRTLMSGKEAVSTLIKDYDFDRIENIVIGYEMEKDPDNSTIINLEPHWYFLYKGRWRLLPEVATGGENDGLE